MPKRFTVRSVSVCRPGYPGAGDDVDLDRLLRGGFRTLFSPWTLLLSGALGISPAILSPARAGEEEPIEKSTEQIEADVAAVREKYIASLAPPAAEQEGATAEGAAPGTPTNKYLKGELIEFQVLPENPKVKLWAVVPLETSPRRIFGVAEAKAPHIKTGGNVEESELQLLFRRVAFDVFGAFGLGVEENVQLELKRTFDLVSQEFEADGYDRNAKVGFEIRTKRTDAELECRSESDATPLRQKLLEIEELPALNQKIKDGELNMFVHDVYKAENSTLDPQKSVEVFIDTLVDYLNWLKSEGKI